MTYYQINEDAARQANDVNSFSDYEEGSATRRYRSMVDQAVEIADRQKARVSEKYHDQIDRLLDSYTRRLAENINRANQIDARVPSVLIAGPSNFPVRKKEKQNAARDRNMEDYRSIQAILDKIRSVGLGGIRSDDADAIPRLTAKLAKLETLQAKMKEANAEWRKRMKAAVPAQLSDEEKQQAEDVARAVPYPSWALSSNSADIRRVKARIAELQKEAEKAEKAEKAAGDGEVTGDGYTLRENREIGRIQFLFDDKPDVGTRALLKSYGFRWAPSEGAWQRMLNDNGRRAAEQIRKALEGQQ